MTAKFEGIAWTIRTQEQLGHLLTHINSLPLPFSVKVGPVQTPKTRSQLNYAHSLCDALAVHEKCSLDKAKRDAKAEFGVVVVDTSLVTGQRSARLVSFADYTETQMEAFLTAMEVFLAERGIPYVPST